MALKALVFLVYSLDLLHTVLSTYYGWITFVNNWGDLQSFQLPKWPLGILFPLSGIIALLVQLFFIWRIWILGSHTRRKALIMLVMGTVLLTGLASFGMSIVFGITYRSKMETEFASTNNILHRAICLALETCTTHNKREDVLKLSLGLTKLTSGDV
ncbi:hypothetical protein H0H92_011622 [Tricholoma furcatifolium]|nr:hypothetical protein H0H92_011622 [Tricholoma furcatifolium]